VNGELANWSPEGRDFTIEYPVELLDAIRNEAVEGLHRLRHRGIEVGGVLFGSKTDRGVRILQHRKFESEYAQGPGFQLSEGDQVALEKLIEDAAREEELSGLEPVGWYHSHTRSGVFLSPEDLDLYNRRFPKLWQIALVLRPTQLGPAEVGFFFREPDGSVRSEASRGEFSIGPLAARRPAIPAALPAPAAWTLARSVWMATAILLGSLGLGVLTGTIEIGA